LIDKKVVGLADHEKSNFWMPNGEAAMEVDRP
jgi:hypothetical protein